MSDFLLEFYGECRRAETYLRDVFGKAIPEEALINLIPKAVRILREDDAERRAIDKGRDLNP